MPRLKIAYDAEHATTPQEPPRGACWQAPMWWVPATGVQHGDTVLGVRWFCAKCGITGPSEFGTAKALTNLSFRSEVAFYKLAQAAGTCPDWEVWKDEGVGPMLKVAALEAAAFTDTLDEERPDAVE